MQRYIIDRFEGEYAVCEDEARQMHLLPRAQLPAGTREGDGIAIDEAGAILPDPERARQNQQAAQALLEKLLKREDER